MKVKILLKSALLIGVIGLVIILAQHDKVEVTGNTVYENGKIDTYFCPEEDCKGKIAEELNKAQESIHCAIYNIDEEPVANTLKNKNIEVKLVTDKSNKKNIEGTKTVKNYGTEQLMHNKFCIIDNKTVVTGSYNPKKSEQNNTNNIAIIESKYIAENYEDEFKELWNKEFGKGKKAKNPIINLSKKRIENYFCPEDKCQEQVLKELEKSKESINFMIFSFTDNKIGEELIQKNKQGIKVEGIMEKTQNSNYTEFHKLKEEGINVKWYEKKYKLHDKVFIIDGKTVITGSYNPTQNADENNDENILIIEDEGIAKKYTERFKNLSS